MILFAWEILLVPWKLLDLRRHSLTVLYDPFIIGSMRNRLCSQCNLKYELRTLRSIFQTLASYVQYLLQERTKSYPKLSMQQNIILAFLRCLKPNAQRWGCLGEIRTLQCQLCSVCRRPTAQKLICNILGN